MENQSLHDVRPEQYASVIRELIRHEDDLTNQRIMWLLVVQGLLANAYISARQDVQAANGVALAGMIVTLSAFASLYKSYQARGYLKFLGMKAKQGKLRVQYLRFDGWPKKRIRHWRRVEWDCLWLRRAGDLLEPYLSLPGIIFVTWMFLVLQRLIPRQPWTALGVAFTLSASIFFLFCAVWVWSQRKDEEELTEEPDRS